MNYYSIGLEILAASFGVESNCSQFSPSQASEVLDAFENSSRCLTLILGARTTFWNQV